MGKKRWPKMEIVWLRYVYSMYSVEGEKGNEIGINQLSTFASMIHHCLGGPAQKIYAYYGYESVYLYVQVNSEHHKIKRTCAQVATNLLY